MLLNKNKGFIRKNEIIRTKEILDVLRKNGLSFLLVKTTLGKNKIEILKGDAQSEKALGLRIKNACEQLGPTFVKLGQILSTRTEIVPLGIANVLKTLQDSVTPFSFEQAKILIESELQAKIDDIFDDFKIVPIASASVCQVYLARLKNKERVAIKVQRPDIGPIVQTDLGILTKLADFAAKHTKYGKIYDFKGMVKEFKTAMEKELDFIKEAENTDKFRENILNHKENATVPKIKWIYTTRKILTMEFIDGIKINNLEKLNEENVDKQKVATTLCTSLIKQILEDGFFHCDPHPGNLFVLKNNELAFIDLGLVGKINNRLKSNLTDMLLGITTQNTRKTAQAIMAMDEAQANVNQRHFEKSLDELLNEFLYIPLKEISVADAFFSIFSLANRYGMIIPREFALIAKCLGTAQGVIDDLDHSVNIMSIAKKCVKSISAHYIATDEFRSDVLSFVMDNADVVKELPSFMLNFMRKMQDNDFTIELKLKKAEKIEKNFEQILNRMSFAVILLAVCIVIAGLIISLGFNGASTSTEDLTYASLRLGVIMAGIIVVGIVISILNSGRNKK